MDKKLLKQSVKRIHLTDEEKERIIKKSKESLTESEKADPVHYPKTVFGKWRIAGVCCTAVILAVTGVYLATAFKPVTTTTESDKGTDAVSESFTPESTVLEDLSEESQVIKSTTTTGASSNGEVSFSGTSKSPFSSQSSKAYDPDTVSGEGVLIPKAVFPDIKSNVDMVGFFIWQGKSYIQYQFLSESGEIVGDYVGTVTKYLDEWSSSDDYVERSGSITGDFYTVKGYDPEFMLCMKFDDGSVCTYINNNDLILKTGSELFKDRLNLSVNDKLFVQTYSQYETGGILEQVEGHQKEIGEFLNALNESAFEYYPYSEKETSPENIENSYRLNFLTENGIDISLFVYPDGRVEFSGLSGVCVRLSAEQTQSFLSLFSG